MSNDESKKIFDGLMNVESYNDQFRQPNPNGRYPVCKPTVGDPQSRCERCGNVVRGDIPCVVVPRDRRFGENAPLPDLIFVGTDEQLAAMEAVCVELRLPVVHTVYPDMDREVVGFRLADEPAFAAALMAIFCRRTDGWWMQQNALIKYHVCDAARFEAAYYGALANQEERNAVKEYRIGYSVGDPKGEHETRYLDESFTFAEAKRRVDEMNTIDAKPGLRGAQLPPSNYFYEIFVANAVRCGICGSGADRFANMFRCQAVAGHIADLTTGIFSDLTFPETSVQYDDAKIDRIVAEMKTLQPTWNIWNENFNGMMFVETRTDAQGKKCICFGNANETFGASIYETAENGNDVGYIDTGIVNESPDIALMARRAVDAVAKYLTIDPSEDSVLIAFKDGDFYAELSH